MIVYLIFFYLHKIYNINILSILKKNRPFIQILFLMFFKNVFFIVVNATDISYSLVPLPLYFLSFDNSGWLVVF